MDKRTQRTKELIKLTFLKMIKDKDINKITVTELCEACNMPRKTFYAHYKSTSDILDELYNSLMEDISNLYVNVLIGAIDDLNVFFGYVNEYILKNLEYYQLLSKSKEYMLFVHRIDDFFAKNILERFDKDFKVFQSVNKYTIYYLLAGITSLYTSWLKNPEECPITYISDTCIKICSNTLDIR